MSALGSHYRATWRVGLPIAVGQVGTIMVGFADTLMVGHYNTASLAAASFVNSVFNLFMFMTMGYTLGLTPLAGRLFGQGRRHEAGSLLRTALYANGLYAAFILLCLLTIYACIDRFGQPPELLPLIRSYFLIVTASMPFVCLFNLLKQFTDAATDTAVAMWVMLSANVLNIVGNYLLIFGIGPFPELGLAGAGLSTLTARAFTAVAMAVFLLRSPRYRSAMKGWHARVARRAGVWRINRQSLPVSLQMGMETGAFTLSGVMVGWLGTVELAGYQVVMTISQLGFLLYYSFGTSTSIRIALYAGLDDWHGVRLAARAGRNIQAALCAAACGIFLGAGRSLINAFTPDAAVRAVAYGLLPVLALYQLGDAMQICYANSLRGTAHVQSVAWVAGVSYLGVSIPMSYVCGFVLGWGEQGIFVGLALGLFTAAVLFHHHFRRVLRNVL